MPSCSHTIRLLDGPHRGRHSVFLGMGLSEDESRYELVDHASSYLCYLEMAISEQLREHGFQAAYDLAEHYARARTVESYVREDHAPWYRAPRYSYAGRFALQVEDGPRGLRLSRGAQILDVLPATVPGRVSSSFDDALALVERAATKFSAIVAALETGAVREAAAASSSAVAASVADARRLAVVGTQLDGARAERVLGEIDALAATVDAAISEALELHLQVRERTPRGLDALPAASQLRAITEGVRSLG